MQDSAVLSYRVVYTSRTQYVATALVTVSTNLGVVNKFSELQLTQSLITESAV